MYNVDRWESTRQGGLAQYQVEKSDDARIQSPAMVFNGSNIFGHVWVTGKSLIKGENNLLEYAMIHDTSVEGQNIISGRTMVIGSSISGKNVICNRAIVDHCQIAGEALISGSAVLQNVEIDGFVVIRDAILRDCRVERGSIIQSGVWEGRAPRVVRLPWMDITEGVNDNVLLDCESQRVHRWLKLGPQIGIKMGLSPDEIQSIRAAILTVSGRDDLAGFAARYAVDQEKTPTRAGV